MTDVPGFQWADWPLSERISAVTSLRSGGVSEAPYHSLNLGSHVGDNPDHVQTNRQRVASALQLPDTPNWLRQTHGTSVFTDQSVASDESYDAAFTAQPGKVLAVLTADCLPVVFASVSGDEIAVAHAGWRGLADGVLQNTMDCFRSASADINVWLGPGIGASKFEVGTDVRDYYQQRLGKLKKLDEAFTEITESGKWHADLYALARLVLRNSGVDSISGGGECTYSQTEKYHSYRRDGVRSGRMATFAWLR